MYKLDPEETLGKQPILFGDFIDPQIDMGPYAQITDFEKLENALDYYLIEYNHQSTKPMKLVLFLDAISHVCRIARIIRQPMGNALLLGMGGSGERFFRRLNVFKWFLICLNEGIQFFFFLAALIIRFCLQLEQKLIIISVNAVVAFRFSEINTNNKKSIKRVFFLKALSN